ncbi:IS3 family transposase [Micromonospora sp. NPDC005171]|uniref:IS3 family transposase n=1 Tax=Micromonospora sp. NPDC005171 TaxID=3156866 RepID=UPI0033BF0375
MYRFIDAEKTTYLVRLLCRLLGVGYSAFYDWLRQGRHRAAERERHDQQRVEITQQAWSEHRGVYGARRLAAELHERGHHWNRKAVARLMRLAGIEGAHRRRRGEPRRKAASTATAPDRVQRVFMLRDLGLAPWPLHAVGHGEGRQVGAHAQGLGDDVGVVGVGLAFAVERPRHP